MGVTNHLIAGMILQVEDVDWIAKVTPKSLKMPCIESVEFDTAQISQILVDEGWV